MAKVRTLSYNIDTNIARTEEGYARETHAAWRANERAPKVVAAIDEVLLAKRPDVVNIQECRQFQTKFGDTVDSLTPLLDLFNSRGYEALVNSYNEAGGDKAFKFITAYDPEKMAVEDSYMRYFTRTPDSPTPRPDTTHMSMDEAREVADQIKAHNFGSEWERGVQVTRFRHRDMDAPFYSINVHLDLPEQHRLKAADLMLQFILEILEHEPHAKIVMEGDFNSFRDRGGPQQLEILRGATFDGQQLLKEATQDLRLPSKEPANFSFIPFPFDLIGLAGRNVNGTDIAEVVASLGSQQHRQDANDALSKAPHPFNPHEFLASLQPECRKAMIGAMFQRCRAIGAILDRVFQRGFETSKCKLLPAACHDTSAITSFNDEGQVRKFINDHPDEPAFASDHQPLLTTYCWA